MLQSVHDIVIYNTKPYEIIKKKIILLMKHKPDS